MELEMDFTLIPVAKILDQIDDPFGRWDVFKPVAQDMVMGAILDGSYAQASESYSHGTGRGAQSAIWHARRIAWLMKNGWDAPIDIDVGIPSMGYCPYILADGHHRLCAAIMTGETVIKAQVSGALDYAFQLFGVDCALDHTPEKVDV
jgi:hypothetical protein